MPVINVEIGKLSVEVKRQLLFKLSDTASAITGIPINAFTVVITELEDDNMGIGGKTVRELKAKGKRE